VTKQRFMMLGLALIAALCSSALLLPVQAQTTGVLEGQVVNGTAGGPAIGAGVAVTLHVFQGELEVNTLEAVTDDGGMFRFDGLDTDPALEYWPEAVYLDVTYPVDEPIRFDDPGADLAATVTVYETTTEDTDIKIDSVHMIAESFGQVLRVSEIHLIGNLGDRTYIGIEGEAGLRETVFVPLPDSAVGLSFGESVPADRFVEVDGGLRDTEPVPPGRDASLVFFSYHIMVMGETVPFERSFAYPTDILNMLVAQPGLTLRSAQLESRGTELFQGREYELHSVVALPADTAVTMELLSLVTEEGMPAAAGDASQSLTGAATGGNQGLMRGLGFGLAALAVIAAVVYPFATRRSPGSRKRGRDLGDNPRDRQLLSELAGLEESYEAGEIDEASYERRRSQIYRALKAL
jgi:hypothetical protein